MKKLVAGPRFNSRIALGVILVVVSVVGVVGVVRVSATSSPIVVATKLLVEGHQITQEDVRESSAQVGDNASKYVEKPALVVGKVVNRAIGAGEFVPISSLSSAADVIATSVVITVDTPIASGLKPGALVDLWAAERKSGSAAPSGDMTHPAQLLLPRIRMASHETKASVVSEGSERVELVVDRDDVAKVLDAQSAGLALSVVSSSGSIFS